MSMPQPKKIKIIEEYIFCEVNDQKMLLTKNQKRVAIDRYERLSPQLPMCALTEVERLQTKYQAELSISAELRKELERVAKENIQVGNVRNHLHRQKLELLRENKRLKARKWYQVIWAGPRGGRDDS